MSDVFSKQLLNVILAILFHTGISLTNSFLNQYRKYILLTSRIVIVSKVFIEGKCIFHGNLLYYSTNLSKSSNKCMFKPDGKNQI